MPQTFPLVGAYYRPPAKAILAALSANTALIARPEPSNDYDPHAVMVLVEPSAISGASLEALEESLPAYGYDIDDFFSANEWHLGYIARDVAGITITRSPVDLRGKLIFTPAGHPCITLEDI